MKRVLSQRGLDLIKSFEGLRLTSYKALGTERYYTIGYGHYGKDVLPYQTITEKQAEDLLYKDLQYFVNHVNTFMPYYNFNQNQFDALVSFAYNVGSITSLTSNGTLALEKIPKMMMCYNKSGGKIVNGLIKRRKKECDLFNEPILKSNEEIAKEVIAGKWGNGNIRKGKLTQAGYNYQEIQSSVNNILSNKTSNKSNEEIAKEVIAGKWGNGNARKTSLTSAGYDYKAIQTLVNKLLKG